MAKNETDTEKSGAERQAPKLPISKIIYGVGMSVRDSWLAFVGSVAVLTPVIAFGSKKYPALEWIAERPDWVKKKIAGLFPNSGGGKWGSAFVVATGIATVVGFLAHMPGLVRGPRKVAEAERMYDDQWRMAQLLNKDNERLKVDNTELKVALEAAKAERGSMADRMNARTTAAAAAQPGLNP